MKIQREWDGSIVIEGDVVTRILGGAIMPLRVSAVTDSLIICGPWTFDKKTGAEIDEDLGWGPPPLWTGSYLDCTTKAASHE